MSEGFELSEVPEGWAPCSLGDGITLDIQPGFACGAHNRDGEGIAHLRPMNVNEEGKIDFENIKFVAKSEAHRDERLLRAGDVLFNNTNSPELVGKTACYQETEARAFSNHMTRVRCNVDALDPQYCAFSLHHLWQQGFYKSICNNHVSQASISRSVLLATKIALPPLAEQKRIVAKVETLLARVDAARQRLTKVPALLKRFRQSVLAAACSGQLTEDWRAKHADAPEWTKTQLGEICEIIGGSQPSKDHFIYEPRDGYIRFIQIRDYKSDDHLTYIPEVMARRFCSETDVMIGRYGPPLFQILRGIEGAYNVALMKAVPRNESLANDFLFYLLQDPPLRQDVIQFSERTVGQDGVRKDLLEVYDVQIPPLVEQHEIVRRVEALLARADRIEKRLATATRRVETLTQAILAQAFRGELVPTEAELARQEGRDYEPASVLLDRIRTDRAKKG